MRLPSRILIRISVSIALIAVGTSVFSLAVVNAGAVPVARSTPAALPLNAANDSGTLPYHPDNFLGDWNSQSTSCGGLGFCVATGQYVDDEGHVQALIDEQLSGVWNAETVPLPSNAASAAITALGTGANPFNTLWGDSCVLALECAAVGQYTNQQGALSPLIDTQAGTTAWVNQVAPLPSNAAGSSQLASRSPSSSDDLNSVSCTSTGGCVAVGQYVTTGGVSQPLIETGSTSQNWSVVTASLPQNKSATLLSVSCASTNYCVAVGEYVDATGYQEALLLTGSVHGHWTSVNVPLPLDAGSTSSAPPSNILYSVSCTGTNDCLVGGQYADDVTPSKQSALGSYPEEPLLVQQTGGAWKNIVAPLPNDGMNYHADSADSITSVTCHDATNCTAVGYYTSDLDDVANQTEALLDVETNGVWSDVVAPLPGDAQALRPQSTLASPDNALFSVSCNAPSTCVASGTYTATSNATTTGVQQTLLLTESNGKWSDDPVSLPAGADQVTSVATTNWALSANMLDTTSCWSSGCVAGGYYLDGDGWTQALSLSVALTGSPALDGAPLAPLIRKITSASGDLVVSYAAAPTLLTLPVMGFQYSLSLSGKWQNCTTLTNSTCDIQGLTPGAHYLVRLRARNAAGAGAASAIIAVHDTSDNVTAVPVLPGAPSVTGVGVQPTSLTVSLRAPARSGSSPVTNYQYCLEANGHWHSTPTSADPHVVISGLLAHHDYVVQFRAVSAAGPGPSSAFVVAATP